MIIEYYSNKGKRKVNEDFILSRNIDKESSLHIIADGMGGYSKGDVASRLVSENIFEYIKSTTVIVSKSIIEKAIVKANENLKEYRSINNIELGTTIGGVYIKKSCYTILGWRCKALLF